MKLKCIGGMRHNQSREIEDHYRVGDQVSINGKITFDISNFEEDLKAFRENRTPKYMTVPYHLYKIETIHFSKERFIKFLIPVDWKVEQALSILLLSE